MEMLLVETIIKDNIYYQQIEVMETSIIYTFSYYPDTTGLSNLIDNLMVTKRHIRGHEMRLQVESEMEYVQLWRRLADICSTNFTRNEMLQFSNVVSDLL